MNKDRSIEVLIAEFCSIILTEKDNLSIQDAKSYIDSLNVSERELLLLADIKSPIVSCVLKNCLNTYILKFQNIDYRFKRVPSPFEFDSGENFIEFKKQFEQLYLQNDTKKTYPNIFEDVFTYIDDISEHYRLFEQFYNIRSQRALAPLIQSVRRDALELVTKKVNEIVNESVDKVVKNASTQAFYQTKITSDALIQKADDVVNRVDEKANNAIAMVEHKVKEATDNAVDAKMVHVTTKISETSVAILGIFSGIVLAVVAGLFYSSTVLENMVDVSLYRLICISSIVGFICFNLIAIMFIFIERFRTTDSTSEGDLCTTKLNVNSKSSTKCDDNVKTRSDVEKGNKPSVAQLLTSLFEGTTKFVNIVLLVIMVITFLLEVLFPMTQVSIKSDDLNINISGDINASIIDTQSTDVDYTNVSDPLETPAFDVDCSENSEIVDTSIESYQETNSNN